MQLSLVFPSFNVVSCVFPVILQILINRHVSDCLVPHHLYTLFPIIRHVSLPFLFS